MGERRQVPRYVTELPAQVAQPPGGPPLHVTVVSLSISGCSLEGSSPLKVNQEAELSFECEGAQFRTQAFVVWKSSVGEAGLRFLDMDAASEQLLRKFCAKLRLQPPGPIPTDLA